MFEADIRWIERFCYISVYFLNTLPFEADIRWIERSWFCSLVFQVQLFEADIRWIESYVFQSFSFNSSRFKADIRWIERGNEVNALLESLRQFKADIRWIERSSPSYSTTRSNTRLKQTLDGLKGNCRILCLSLKARLKQTLDGLKGKFCRAVILLYYQFEADIRWIESRIVYDKQS